MVARRIPVDQNELDIAAEARYLVGKAVDEDLHPRQQVQAVPVVA